MNFIFRNFIYLLRKFTSSSLLNLLGLSAAFAIFIVIAIQSYWNVTYNNSFSKIDTIEYLNLKYSDGQESQWMSFPMAERADSVIPEIKRFCVVGNWGNWSVNKSPEDASVFTIHRSLTSRGFLDIFAPEIIKGSTAGLFEDVQSALISEDMAKKIFGDEDPIGKNLYNHYDKSSFYTIVAVYKDFPENSSLKNGLYVKNTITSPSEWSFNLYFDIVQGSRETIYQKLNSTDYWGEEAMQQMVDDPTSHKELYLKPLKNIYMDTPGNKSSFISLVAIGIVILLIAYINYLNFSVAMAPSRVRSVNLHKILGINRSFLTFSVQMEGVILALIAYLLSLFYLYIFSGMAVSTSYFTADLSLSANWKLLLVIGATLLLLISVVGIYPARYLTSFQEAVALKGSFALSPKGIKLRNILIIIQFTASMFLISVASFIKIQHSYMQKYNWGIEKENIVVVPLTGLNTNFKTFGEEVKKLPSVVDYTASRFMPGQVYMGWGRNFEGIYINIKAWPVLPNFLDFFGAKITAGEGFTEVMASDLVKTDQVILNEKFLEKYEFDYNIIGKDFPTFRNGVIKGIAGNVNFESVREPIQPMAFINFYDNMQIEQVFFKISGSNVQEIIADIQKVWGTFSKDDFQFKFLDEELDKLYTNEGNMAKLLGLFGIITIIIAVMGIYGLIIFNTRYKEKEIGIRKVNGATEMEIVLMLNKNMFYLQLIAFVIATPLAYYTIQKWLDNFAYKASVPWWLFLASGLLVSIISIFTISWQSWKAATANPVDAIKSE